jgi:hypothetical protein
LLPFTQRFTDRKFIVLNSTKRIYIDSNNEANAGCKSIEIGSFYGLAGLLAFG